MHICEAIITPLEAIGQAFMIDPQAMQDRGMKIMHTDPVLHSPIPEFIRCAIRRSAFGSTALSPKGTG